MKVARLYGSHVCLDQSGNIGGLGDRNVASRDCRRDCPYRLRRIRDRFYSLTTGWRSQKPLSERTAPLKPMAGRCLSRGYRPPPRSFLPGSSDDDRSSSRLVLAAHVQSNGCAAAVVVPIEVLAWSFVRKPDLEAACVRDAFRAVRDDANVIGQGILIPQPLTACKLSIPWGSERSRATVRRGCEIKRDHGDRPTPRCSPTRQVDDQSRRALDAERERSAALAKELEVMRRELEARAAQLRRISNDAKLQEQAAAGTISALRQSLQEERDKLVVLQKETSAVREAMLADDEEHRRVLRGGAVLGPENRKLRTLIGDRAKKSICR